MIMNRLILSFILLLIIFSCKKENQPSEPDITVVSPKENQVITIPDSIAISVDVISKSIINDLKISFVNKNLIPISDQISMFPSDYDLSINQLIYIDYLNEAVMVPPYYLSIIINSNDGTFRKYVQVSFEQIESPLNGYVLADQLNYGEFILKKCDKKNEVVHEQNIDGVFSNIEYVTSGNLLFISESLNNKVYALSAINFETLWETEPQLPYPEIYDLTLDENILYYTSGIGRIVGKNTSDGVTKITTTTTPDTIPNIVGISDEYLVTDFTLRNPGTKGWYTYYKATGARYLRYLHNYETVEIIPCNSKFVIFCNGGSSSKIVIFKPAQNEITGIVNVMESPIGSACTTTSDSFLFSVNGDLFIFYLSSESYSKILSLGEQILDIKFDNFSSIIYLVTQESLYISDLNGNNTNIITAGNNLKSIELIYGRK